MEKNRDVFLSIGEFSKLTRCSIPSLRYYEQIGALVPAYVNPETKYRYYSLQQVNLARLVKLAIEAGMSPRDLRGYFYSGDAIDVEDLLEEFAQYAERQYRQARIERERTREQLVEYRRQIAVNPGEFRWVRSGDITELQLFFNDTIDDFDYRQYLLKLGECAKIAQELDIATLSQQGIECSEEGRWYVYFSVLDEDNLDAKVSGRKDLRIVRYRKDLFLTAAVHGSSVENCFKNILSSIDAREISALTELWGVTMLAGFASVEVTYRFDARSQNNRSFPLQLFALSNNRLSRFASDSGAASMSEDADIPNFR